MEIKKSESTRINKSVQRMKKNKLINRLKNKIINTIAGVLTAIGTVSCSKDDLFLPRLKITPPSQATIMVPENNLVGSEVFKNFWQYTDVLPADRGNFMVAVQEPNGNVSPRFEADGNGNIVTTQSFDYEALTAFQKTAGISYKIVIFNSKGQVVGTIDNLVYKVENVGPDGLTSTNKFANPDIDKGPVGWYPAMGRNFMKEFAEHDDGNLIPDTEALHLTRSDETLTDFNARTTGLLAGGRGVIEPDTSTLAELLGNNRLGNDGFIPRIGIDPTGNIAFAVNGFDMPAAPFGVGLKLIRSNLKTAGYDLQNGQDWLLYYNQLNKPAGRRYFLAVTLFAKLIKANCNDPTYFANTPTGTNNILLDAQAVADWLLTLDGGGTPAEIATAEVELRAAALKFYKVLTIWDD